MIDWCDSSDRRSRFFQGEVRNEQATFEDVLRWMLDFLSTEIVGAGNGVQFDRILFETNCDTGRLILAATTAESQPDGCSVRLQPLQDEWYDLAEQSDEDFTAGVRTRVVAIARLMCDEIAGRSHELLGVADDSGFDFIAFGSEPGKVVFEQRFSSQPS